MNSNMADHGSHSHLAPFAQHERSQSNSSQQSTSTVSSAYESSSLMPAPLRKASLPHVSTRPSTSTGQSSINIISSHNFSRPAPRSSGESVRGSTSSVATITAASHGHRPRQHSQGFFEPSLPHTSSLTNLAATLTLSTSQIAAQTAMNHLGAPASHERKRSIPGLFSINTTSTSARRGASPTVNSPPVTSAPGPMQTTNSNSMVAASAANAAFPRSPLPSPSPLSPDGPTAYLHHGMFPPQTNIPEKEVKPQRSKIKLFSKPKSIGISKDKDADKKNVPMPSPVRSILRPNFASASTTSLLEHASSAASIYSASNASTSTLVPINQSHERDKDKDRHRPHFLSRTKHKQSERNLQLSSASSNSQAVDPTAPQSLYSFAAPQSPGAQSTFSKSMSGFDLRHGGRALREKKKEERAAAQPAHDLGHGERGGHLGAANGGVESIFGPSSSSTNLYFDERSNSISAAAFTSLGSTMGLTGITPDDAWPLLKARLLNIFEGEDLRTPIEDFNLLVSVHVRRCVQKRAPVVLLEDLRELLDTGFSSLAQTIRNLTEDRLVPRLVELWLMVYCTILPFLQAVFLPLDLEFRGSGSVLSAREATDFWGSLKGDAKADEVFDVRRITLIAFRDTVILPRHETLLNLFSRLSLDSISSGPLPVDQYTAATRVRGQSNAALFGTDRPATGGSLSPHLGSFNSQASTLLDAASSSSGGALSHTLSRSRATSNTSAGSFAASFTNVPSPIMERPLHNNTPPLPTHRRQSSQVTNTQNTPSLPADPTKVTETVARMLQCVSVVAATQTGDANQAIVDRLNVALKHNWLGRGRTGRQRRGWVGMRVGGMVGA